MDDKLLKSDCMEFIQELDGERYYLFIPKITRLFPKSGNMRKMTPKEIALFIIRKHYGYRVYVITDIEDNVKGSIVISNAGSFRYPFAECGDLIDGPSYTVPQYRGTGVAVRLGDAILHRFEHNYRTVFGTIEESNKASLRRAEKNGFAVIGRLKVDVLRRFLPSETGKLLLVAYRNSAVNDNQQMRNDQK